MQIFLNFHLQEHNSYLVIIKLYLSGLYLYNLNLSFMILLEMFFYPIILDYFNFLKYLEFVNI